MVLVGAAILPHGAMIFDGDPHSSSARCRQRHQELPVELKSKFSEAYAGTFKTAKDLALLEPSLIILITPHGVSCSHQYCIYMNKEARGNCFWADQWSEFETEVTIDIQKSRDLMTYLNQYVGHSDDQPAGPVQAVRIFADMEAPLRVAEALPIWNISQSLKRAATYIIISEDLEPMSGAPEPWRLKLGQGIAEFAAALHERVAVVLSGQLCHQHKATCSNPLYLQHPKSRFPVTEDLATDYDWTVRRWVESVDSVGFWQADLAFPNLKALVGKHSSAWACGTKGFVVIHAILEAVSQAINVKVKPVVNVFSAPTYYGILAAIFNFNRIQQSKC